MASFAMPSELAEIIALHRAMFGGFTMMAEDLDGDAPPPEEPVEPEGDYRDRFEAQRKVNRDLERKLSEAYGQLKDADTAAQAAVKDSQDTAAKATSEATRLRVALRNGITVDDAETFLTGADEAALTKQAERLKELSKLPEFPPFDPTQGAQGFNNQPNAQPGAPRMAQAFDEALTQPTH